jgi:tetratricopeptide (TPR) repeat protein
MALKLTPVREIFGARRGAAGSLKYLCALTLIVCTTASYAQHHGGAGAPPSPPPPPAPPSSATTFDQEKLALDSNANTGSAKDMKESNCFLPPLNGLQTVTVGIADLQIPAKAKNEYDQGCAALRSKNLAAAEKHLRNAVKQYQKYAAAWVMLGQSLEAGQKTEEARDACAQPITGGSDYLPAFLCLADISARLGKWDEVLKLSSRVLELDPTTNAVGYAYNAAANFNLHNLSKAETSALKAIEIDRSNNDPRIHFLLAQIYEGKGDRSNEASQLREYLKYATDLNDVAMIKSYLSNLEPPESDQPERK